MIYKEYLVLVFITFTISTHAGLQKIGIGDNGAICNDGTRGQFYIELTASTKWIMYVEGGGTCDTIENCRDRYRNDFDLMSSTFWPEIIEGYDILSNDVLQNPAYATYNKVLIPYCTSDFFIGRSDSSENTGTFFFRGDRYFRGVIDDLLGFTNISSATEFTISGSSAGGIGVLNHLNYISDSLPNVQIRGLIDSAWFVDFEETVEPDDAFNLHNTSEYCPLSTGNSICCLIGDCLLSQLKTNIDVAILQSAYDAYNLGLGALANSELTGTDSVIMLIDRYGTYVKSSVNMRAAQNPRFSFFLSNCIQHKHLVPSIFSIQEIDSIEGLHHPDIFPGAYKNIHIGNISMFDFITAWQGRNATLKIQDNSCDTPLCSSGCQP